MVMGIASAHIPPMSRIKPKLDAEVIGERIARVREARGYEHQRDVYEVLNIDASSWSAWEKGDRVPPLAKIVLIARFFSVPVEYLIEGTHHRMDYEMVSKLGLNRPSEA